MRTANTPSENAFSRSGVRLACGTAIIPCLTSTPDVLPSSGYSAPSLQEMADAVRDLAGVGFEREVAGVQEADDRAGNIALERLGTRRKKERIVPAPYRQKRRLVSAEVFLKRRIECDIALVIAEQVELHLIGAGTGQVIVVEVLTIR